MTGYYKSKQFKRKEFYDLRTEEIKTRQKTLIDEYFQGKATVRGGPFKGMKYIEISHGSQLLPKLLGSYEEPIHKWVENVIKKRYRVIVDIGCAEGYYAIGFALKIPEATVYAYDTNEEAIKMLETMAKMNQVDGRIKVGAFCDHKELNEICSINTLVFCDIEGDERELLDPIKVPNIINADLIIESHDFFRPGTTELLIGRFSKTHKISIVVDYSRDREKYISTLDNKPSDNDLDMIFDEIRAGQAKYLFCKAFKVE